MLGQQILLLFKNENSTRDEKVLYATKYTRCFMPINSMNKLFD